MQRNECSFIELKMNSSYENGYFATVANGGSRVKGEHYWRKRVVSGDLRRSMVDILPLNSMHDQIWHF